MKIRGKGVISTFVSIKMMTLFCPFLEKLDIVKSELRLFIFQLKTEFQFGLFGNSIKELPSCWCLTFSSLHLLIRANWSELVMLGG